MRFKSEVVACGVVYAAARRFQVPLPDNWWNVFDAEESGINEVCRVLAHLYSFPKAQYIPLCRDGDSFTASKSWDAQSQADKKEGPTTAVSGSTTPKSGLVAGNPESGGSKDAIVKAALDKLKESKKSDDDSKSVHIEVDAREESAPKSKSEQRADASGDRNKQKERDRERDKDRSKGRDRVRDSDREREREETEREREKVKDRVHRSKDKGKDSGGHSDKSRHHSSRDREYYSSYSSRDKDRHRHHSYT